MENIESGKSIAETNLQIKKKEISLWFGENYWC